MGYGFTPRGGGNGGAAVGRVLDADGAEAFYWGDGGFQSSEDLVDRSGNGYTLVPDAQGFYTVCTAIPPNTTDGYNGHCFFLNDANFYYHDDSVAGGLRFPSTVTVQCLVHQRMEAGFGNAGIALSYGGTGRGTDSTNNVLYELRVYDFGGGAETFQGEVEMRWQDGVNNDIFYSAPIACETDEWVLLTAVRFDEGGGNVGVELYANEALIGSASGLAEASGGEDQILSIGGRYNNRTFVRSLEGGLAQVRIWGARRTAAAIADDVARVLPLQADG